MVLGLGILTPNPHRKPSPPTPSPVGPGEGAMCRVIGGKSGIPFPVSRRAGKEGNGRAVISHSGIDQPDSGSWPDTRDAPLAPRERQRGWGDVQQAVIGAAGSNRGDGLIGGSGAPLAPGPAVGSRRGEEQDAQIPGRLHYKLRLACLIEQDDGAPIAAICALAERYARKARSRCARSRMPSGVNGVISVSICMRC